MGCDIHNYLEKRKGNEAWSNDKDGNIPLCRHYDFFTLLAGVRMYDDFKGQYLEPKGFPNDACDEVKSHYYIDADFEEVDWDWHTPSWVTTQELEWVAEQHDKQYPHIGVNGCDFHELLQTMKKYEADGYECRLVFWFDN
ncbi:MAG: hypothetical protein K2K82_08770 [Muribaculaceae bacterium]|nr:hypothetical protein [Muribaculaceae bacterium]